MTSIFKTPYGEMQQFVQDLHTGGFTYEDVKKVRTFPNLAGTMVNALHAVTQRSTRQLVEQQLNIWKSLGVAISDEQWKNILQKADAFNPVTDSDEPLVTGGFGYANPKAIVNNLFGAFIPPDGYTKYNFIDDAELRYVPGMKPSGELRLVHYDPNAYAGLSTVAAVSIARTDRLRLAGVEVLEHLVLSPKSGLTWDGELYYYPSLSGLQLKYATDWSFVPCVQRWDDSNLRFRLSSSEADDASALWSSPVVRG